MPNKKFNNSPRAIRVETQNESIKINENLNHNTRDDLKKAYKDHEEIIYLFTVYDYEIKYKRKDREQPNLKIDVFKMKTSFKKYQDFIKYDKEYDILGFPKNNEIYLYKHEYLEDLILYCKNTAGEDINIHKVISKIGVNYGEINIY